MPWKSDTCCFCIDLKIGCLTIAYIRLILNIEECIRVDSLINKLQDLGLARSSGVSDGVFKWIVVSTLILSILFNIGLILGIHRHNRPVIKAFLNFSSAVLVITSVVFIIELVNNRTQEKIITFIIATLIQLYIILLMRNFYIKIPEYERKPTINHPV